MVNKHPKGLVFVLMQKMSMKVLHHTGGMIFMCPPQLRMHRDKYVYTLHLECLQYSQQLWIKSNYR